MVTADHIGQVTAISN